MRLLRLLKASLDCQDKPHLFSSLCPKEQLTKGSTKELNFSTKPPKLPSAIWQFRALPAHALGLTSQCVTQNTTKVGFNLLLYVR